MKRYMKSLSALLLLGVFYCSFCCVAASVGPRAESTHELKQVEEVKTCDNTGHNEKVGRLSPERYLPTLSTQRTSSYQLSMDAAVQKMFDEKEVQPVVAQLAKVDAELTGFYQHYWKAYLYYYEAAFYQGVMQDKTKAEKIIDIALAELQEEVYENSDYYALLAMCTSFSIQYVNILRLGKVSADVIAYGQKALALNKANLRAYFVLASHNFHTPKMFGGMVKVEEYALKGLSCPDELESTPQAPSWGRDQLYQLLVHYYESEGRTKDLELLKKNNPHYVENHDS
ncbi:MULTISPECIES: hypothetical protein [unclassified Myroides]|uniref:hypothetical protein n=1 Tax=unclassified Myroides TaxID=2642485 RepID=UPI0015FB6ACA|nr:MULTISPECIES: hypothetical protein [unclassified Myroides]MBB1150235.1 hypothetical protein [Myroides sp. NP-2]MDM1407321.1 hypothetical protein [Myroides sp. DF42-4-2]